MNYRHSRTLLLVAGMVYPMLIWAGLRGHPLFTFVKTARRVKTMGHIPA